MNHEQDALKKRYLDLSRQANRRGIAIYSDFLTLNEQNLLHEARSQLETPYELDGGTIYAERKMAAFLPDGLAYEWKFPYVRLKICPKYPKYADPLTHRDILGAVMNLGLERSKIGDILCQDGGSYYLFSEEKIGGYLCEALTKIRHTEVEVKLPSENDMLEPIVPKFLEKNGIITSNRLDSVVACFCNCSRSEASCLVLGGKVFVNGQEMISNTYACKEGDILSVRSFGKFIFDSCGGETKKGRVKIQYRVYA